MTFGRYEILEKCPLSPILVSNSLRKFGFEKSHILDQLNNPKPIQTATLIIFRHKWEDGSRKVNMNAVNFSPPHEDFVLL